MKKFIIVFLIFVVHTVYAVEVTTPKGVVDVSESVIEEVKTQLQVANVIFNSKGGKKTLMGEVVTIGDTDYPIVIKNEKGKYYMLSIEREELIILRYKEK